MFSFSFVNANEDKTNSNKGRPELNSDQQERRDAFQIDQKNRRDAFKAQMDQERKVFLDDLKAKREFFIAELKARKEEWKLNSSEKKEEYCEKVEETLDVRYNVAISRLSELQDRIAGIVAKFKNENKDTSLAEESLNLSKSKLLEAIAKLAELEKSIPKECDNFTVETFGIVKLGARDTKDILKESREALRQTIKELMSLKK